MSNTIGVKTDGSWKVAQRIDEDINATLTGACEIFLHGPKRIIDGDSRIGWIDPAKYQCNS